MRAHLLAWMAATLLAFGMPASAQAPATSPSSAQERTAVSPNLSAQLPLRRDGEATGVIPGATTAWLAVLVLALGGFLLVRQVRTGQLPWSLKRSSSSSGELRVLSVRALGSQVSLQLVEWNGRQLLLGCTAHAITVLDSRNCVEAAVTSGHAGTSL